MVGKVRLAGQMWPAKQQCLACDVLSSLKPINAVEEKISFVFITKVYKLGFFFAFE